MPVSLTFLVSQETVDVFQVVGLMFATAAPVVLLLVEPQAAAPMAARPTTTHSR